MKQENSLSNHTIVAGSSSKLTKSPLAIILAGFVVLLVLLGGMLWVGLSWLGKAPKSEDLNALRSDLVQLEGRLVRLEGVESKVASLQREMQGLQEKMSNFQLSLNVFGDRLRRLTEESSKEPKGPTAIKGKAEAPPVPEVKEQYHVVRAGETLYGISRKYGISATRICEINGMKQGEPIHVGQKIKVENLQIRKLENEKNLRQD